MNEFVKLALDCLLGIVWIFLNIAGVLYVLRRGPTRTSVAAVTGVASVIYVFLGVATGLDPNLAYNQPRFWLIALAVGLLFFIFALLGTYITPAFRGTTWEDMIESARSAARKSKKSEKKNGQGEN